MNLSISIVNYNNKQLTLNCLESIIKNTKNINYEIVLVDNNSIDDSVESIKQKYPQVKLIESKTNNGFTKNQNMAIKVCNGEYILVLNNDTVVLDEAISKILEFAKTKSDAGAIGFKLLNPDGTYQITSLRGKYNLLAFFSLKTGLSELFTKSGVWGNVHLGHLDRDKVQEMDAFSGAAVLIKKKVFDEIGLLDENIFFGPDDLDFSYRLKKAGYKIYYFPEAKIMHYWGQTAKTNTPKHFAIEHQGIFRFYLKHYGIIKTIILRLMVLISAVFQIIYNFIKVLFGSNAAESKIWIRAYWEAMKVCFKYPFVLKDK